MKNQQRKLERKLLRVNTENDRIVARLEDLAQTLPIPAWLTNDEGYMCWFNKEWYRFSGTTPKQMKNWAWQNFYPPTHIARVIQSYYDAIENQTVWEDKFPFNCSGKYIWVFGRAIPILNARKATICWFGYYTPLN